MPSGLTSISSASRGASKASWASFEKASAERPWNERCQSTWRAPSSSSMGLSVKPAVRSGKGFVAVPEGLAV